MADVGIQEGISDEVRAPMCQLHNLAIEFYCQKHNKTLCRTCKVMEHRKCQLQDIEHAATGNSGRNIEVLEQLKEVKTQMEKIGEVMGNEKEILESYKATAIEQIERKIKEIEILGKKKIAEVDDIFKQERANLDDESNALTHSKVLVDESIQKLEKATNVGSEEDIFVTTKTAESDLAKFQDIVEESSHLSHAEVAFALDSRLADIDTMGDVSVERQDITVDLTPDVPEVLNTGDSDINILWFDILSGERMVLLTLSMRTNGASQLRLYSANKKLVSTLDLPNIASADTVDDQQVIIPLNVKQKLQIVNVDTNNLTNGPVINMNVAPVMILQYSDRSVLVLARSDNKFCFQILDLTGKVEKHVKLSADLKLPSMMRMNHERNAVYIADAEKGCLGFNLKGGVIFHYTQAGYDVSIGLAIDPRGAIYIAVGKQEDDETACVVKLSPAGQVLRQIGIRGLVPLQCIGNKVYYSNMSLSDTCQKDSVVVRVSI